MSKDPVYAAVSHVAATKLQPQYNNRYVKRQRLLAKTDAILQCRLTIVHAGAGYGKSSILNQWLQLLRKQDISTAWLTLEEEEANLHSFMAHLITVCVKAGYLEETILTNIGVVDERIPLEALMTAFINAVNEQVEPLVIFLDEYNRIQSDDMNSFLQVMIRNIPVHVHFVIASRWRPQIGIENLRVNEDLLEVTSNDLRFSPNEISNFLEHFISGLDQELINKFVTYTEGWPMALQMLRLWLSGRDGSIGLINSFLDNSANIASYLTEQVLSELPEDEQLFLMKTSVLEKVNGDIANAITGRTDSWLVLEQLYERNLFLEPSEGDRQWFRFHAVFLEYLRDLLKKHHPGTLISLHEKAAGWHEARGHVRRAIYHAQAAGNNKLVAAVLSQAGGWRLVMDGRMDVIHAAIEKLPESIIQSSPKLMLGQTLLMLKVGHIDEAYQYFNQLDVQNKDMWSEQDVTDYKIIENTLSDYADERVSYEEIQNIEALKNQIPKKDHLMQALLSDSLATKFYAMRLFEQAHTACVHAISHYRALRSFYGEMFVRFKQAQAYFAQGSLSEAEAILRQNQEDIEIRFGSNTDLAAHNAIFIAELLVERHLLDEADKHLQNALPSIEQADGWFELYAAAYSSATVIEWQKSGIEGVMKTLERARAVGQSRSLERLEVVANFETVFYMCLDGQPKKAEKNVTELEAVLVGDQNQVHFLTPHIAVCLSIYYLVIGKYEAADMLMEKHGKASEAAGDARQLIAVYLVSAISCHIRNDIGQAAIFLDQAIQCGLFKGFRHSYIRYTLWLLPLMNRISKDETLLAPDRYRENFLSDIRREMKNWEHARLNNERVLTIAELDVLKELNQGRTNKEIAIQLGISPNTVKFRLKNIFAKFGISKRNNLVRFVREEGLVPSFKSQGDSQ